MKNFITRLQVNSRSMAFDPASGDTFRLEGPAAEIILLKRDASSEADILDYIVKNYEVSETVASRDLDAFFARLQAIEEAQP